MFQVSEGSVCQGAQDEKAILLLPDPLQQFVDSRNSQRLGPQRTEAEVKFEATCHLAEEKGDKDRQNENRNFSYISHLSGSAQVTQRTHASRFSVSEQW